MTSTPYGAEAQKSHRVIFGLISNFSICIGSKLQNKHQDCISLVYFEINIFAGVYSRGATPDPIPNSEVKSSCGDGIALVTMWESSTTPALFYLNPGYESNPGFFVSKILPETYYVGFALKCLPGSSIGPTTSLSPQSDAKFYW